MCRQNHALGLAIVAFFGGLFIGCCCELTFGVFFIGIGGIFLGFGLMRKK